MRGRSIAMRWGVPAGAALLLAGCAMFAPRYDPMLDAKTASAYELVARFAANGELGTYADKTSFADAAPHYADAQAQLAVAQMRAASLETGGKGAAHARDLLVKLIKGCSDRITSFALQHKRFGIQPDSGATQPMMVSCDQAARAAQAMKPGT